MQPGTDRGWIRSVVPGVGVARSYRREWLRRDLVAGDEATGVPWQQLFGARVIVGGDAGVLRGERGRDEQQRPGEGEAER